jgi:hypothetical protein
MKFENFVYLCVNIVLCLLAIGCSKAGKQEKFFESNNIIFQFDTTSMIDVEEGEIITVNIPFIYTGNKTAKFLSIKGDCSCTELKVSEQEFFPKCKYFLDLKYDSRGQSDGVRETKVVLQFLEEDSPRFASFSVPFQIHRRIILDSPTINLGVVNESAIIDKTVQIKIAGTYDFQKIKLSSSSNELLTEIVPLSN